MRVRRILLAIATLSVVGIVVSSVSLYHHYDRSHSSFCDFGGNFNCDIVNRSIYSEVFGIPVALVGIAGYAGILALATILKPQPKILLAVSLAGLAFALWLTYIEGFVLAAWCVLCLTSLAIIFTIAVLSVIAATHSAR